MTQSCSTFCAPWFGRGTGNWRHSEERDLSRLGSESTGELWSREQKNLGRELFIHLPLTSSTDLCLTLSFFNPIVVLICHTLLAMPMSFWNLSSFTLFLPVLIHIWIETHGMILMNLQPLYLSSLKDFFVNHAVLPPIWEHWFYLSWRTSNSLLWNSWLAKECWYFQVLNPTTSLSSWTYNRT